MRSEALISAILENTYDPAEDPRAPRINLDGLFDGAREHAWITDKDEYIKLAPKEHHIHWLKDHPEVHDGLEPKDSHDFIRRKGWIRKIQSNYYVAAHGHQYRVLDHVKQMHPDIDKVTISLVSPKMGNLNKHFYMKNNKGIFSRVTEYEP